MARKTFVELIDDLDGSTAKETVTFGLDGVEYEIDLSEENAAKLRESLAEWTAQGRRVGGRRQRGTGSRQSSAPGEAARIRAWARENGYDVPDRGRIPSNIREDYEKAGE